MEMKRKFDVVVMNPPYQASTESTGAGKGSRNSIWPSFVNKSFDICAKDGYVCAVHPNAWRKINNKIGDLLKSKSIKYISMHSKHEGQKVFKAFTPFDWYVAQNRAYQDNFTTEISDFNNKKILIDINKYNLIPHFNIELLDKLMAKTGEEKVDLIQSFSAYEARNSYVSTIENNEFKFPLIASTNSTGVKYLYSSRKDKGHFGVPKVIFGDNGGDTGILNAVIDFEGKYGMSNHAMGIKISSKKEGENIKKAIESDKFKSFLNSTCYSGFIIEWKTIAALKKDFWKEFI